MKTFTRPFIALVLVMLTGSFNGCAGNSRNTPLTHFPSRPTAKINWPGMVLTIPHSVVVSELNISPKAKIEGNNIIISARYVRSNKPEPTTFVFDLSKLGMKPEWVSSAKVFWANPDGTKTEIEIIPSQPKK
jgi:hypothetical protein